MTITVFIKNVDSDATVILSVIAQDVNSSEPPPDPYDLNQNGELTLTLSPDAQGDYAFDWDFTSNKGTSHSGREGPTLADQYRLELTKDGKVGARRRTA